MTECRRKYRWAPSSASDADPDGKRREDYVAYDAEVSIGRIFLETDGPMKGLWRWTGGLPEPIEGAHSVPGAGHSLTAEDAARKVEEYWDATKARL